MRYWDLRGDGRVIVLPPPPGRVGDEPPYPMGVMRSAHRAVQRADIVLRREKNGENNFFVLEDRSGGQTFADLFEVGRSSAVPVRTGTPVYIDDEGLLILSMI